MSIKTYFPSLEDWEHSIGNTIRRRVYQDLAGSKWEKNLHLFVRMITGSKLEEDPRPSFNKWVKTLNYKDAAEFVKDTGIALNPEEMAQINRESTMKFAFTIPYNLYATLLGYYRTIYPQSMVKKTKVGEFAEKFLEGLDQEMHLYIRNYMESLIRELEWIYATCVKTKEKGLDHRTLNFDWGGLATKLYNFQGLASFHRSYYDSNVYSEIARIHDGWQQTEFVIDALSVLLFKDFGVNPKRVCRVDNSLLDFEPFFDLSFDADCLTADDNTEKLSESRTYKSFVERLGKLWEDDFVDQ